MPTLSSYVLDNGLQAIDALADKIFVCSQEPTTYSEATTTGTYALGVKDFGSPGGAINGTMADAPPNGRKVITNAIAGGALLQAGTVSAWAVVDSANSRLLATSSVTPLAISGAFNMNAFAITEPSPTALSRLVGDIWAVSANSDLSRIVAASQQNGTQVAVSTDGGNNFSMNATAMTSGDVIRDTMFVDETSTVLLGTIGGFIYRTTDLGGTWSTLSAPGSRNWGSMARTDDASKLIISSSTNSYLSTDQGATWTIRTNNAPAGSGYNMLCGSSDFSILYSCDAFIVYSSTDLGQTWTALPNTPTYHSWFQGMTCSADGQIIMLGDYGGYLARSVNGGSTWSYQNLGSTLNAFRRRVPGTSGDIVALSGNYFLVTSVDGGANWTPDSVLAPYWVNNFTSPWETCISSNGNRLVTGTEYFNFQLLIRG